MEQILANGLYLGAQYALIALGLTLIFSLMNVLNFAHGQMYVFGGFVTYTVVAQLGLPFIVGLIASAVVLAVMGALIEKFLFRPVIRKSKRDESTMLLAAGIAIALRLRRSSHPRPRLNMPDSGLIGRHGVLTEPGTAGPRVRVGDSDWAARLPRDVADSPAGTRVRVEGVDGTTLVVRPE